MLYAFKWTEGRGADIRADMTKIFGAFGKCANAPNNV